MSPNSCQWWLLQAVRRRQARLASEAERYAIAKSPIRYAPSEAAKANVVRANAATALGLCAHGRVPRLIAERMGMPRLACAKCA